MESSSSNPCCIGTPSMNDDYKDALIDKIHTWTYDTLNDDAKLSAWHEKFDYIIPTEKEIALDELFGVK